jgi:hypothetical protein
MMYAQIELGLWRGQPAIAVYRVVRQGRRWRIIPWYAVAVTSGSSTRPAEPAEPFAEWVAERERAIGLAGETSVDDLERWSTKTRAVIYGYETDPPKSTTTFGFAT